jgi:ribulose-bisphosphate carboxylase large chain
MSTINVTYQVWCAADEVEQVAKDIALEQTVEVPQQLVTSPKIAREVVGQVASIANGASDGLFTVAIRYQAALANRQLPQLLNLIYGNISIKNNIRVLDVSLPDDFLSSFRGPNHGIEGLRAALGVYGRPLVATALKPRGSPVKHLAKLAHYFALGGGDIIKDDHNLVDNSVEDFRARVRACQQAVDKANSRTGRNCLYFPNLCMPAEHLEQALEAAAAARVHGLLVSPLLLGLDVVRRLAETHPWAIMAHPTFSGAFFHDRHHGMLPGVFLGSLFRLAGADISVFPNFGGRFGFSREDCAGIADSLRRPLGQLRPSLPAPAGGMKYENIPLMAEQYGVDAVFLCGGALLTHGKSLRDSTRFFLDGVRAHFSEKLVPPNIPNSACELPVANLPGAAILEHLRFSKKFKWQGRPAQQYKAGSALPFKGVIRHELVGRAGERTAFDVRYFEIAPGGYSSLEKHVHTHCIVALRGKGSLQVGENIHTLKPFDVAYVPSSAVHQLRNQSRQPFGFFCIVDHERDRPAAP